MNEQQQRALAEGLKALAERSRSATASPRIQQAVLAEMEGLHGDRRPRLPRTGQSAGTVDRRFLALAAGLLVAVGAALWTARFEHPATPDIIHPAGFVSIPGAGILPEIESASIVRVSLPVSALPVYGVAINPEVTTDSVQAELLVAQDGQTRAIRFVNSSNNARSMSND